MRKKPVIFFVIIAVAVLVAAVFVLSGCTVKLGIEDAKLTLETGYKNTKELKSFYWTYTEKTPSGLMNKTTPIYDQKDIKVQNNYSDDASKKNHENRMYFSETRTVYTDFSEDKSAYTVISDGFEAWWYKMKADQASTEDTFSLITLNNYRVDYVGKESDYDKSEKGFYANTVPAASPAELFALGEIGTGDKQTNRNISDYNISGDGSILKIFEQICTGQTAFDISQDIKYTYSEGIVNTVTVKLPDGDKLSEFGYIQFETITLKEVEYLCTVTNDIDLNDELEKDRNAKEDYFTRFTFSCYNDGANIGGVYGSMTDPRTSDNLKLDTSSAKAYVDSVAGPEIIPPSNTMTVLIIVAVSVVGVLVLLLVVRHFFIKRKRAEFAAQRQSEKPEAVNKTEEKE